MSFFSKYQFSRPSKAIPWYTEVTPKEIWIYLTANYYETKLWIANKREGTGTLVMTVTSEWESKNAFDQWFHDPNLLEWHKQRDDYHKEHGIILLGEEYYYS